MLLYIDPGTGSMLFTILIGLLGALLYALKRVWIKIRFLISGGRKAIDDQDKASLAIFSEGKRYVNTFEPILDELEKRGQRTVYLTAEQNDPLLQKAYQNVESRFIGEGNAAYARLNMLKADVVLATTPGLDVYQWRRSKDVKWYVHIPHAPNDITLYRMFGIDYYDAILLSGGYQEEQIRLLEKLRNLPAKELEQVGVVYLDRMKKRLDSAEKKDANPTRTILLAPSWGSSAILQRFGTKIIDELLSLDIHLIIRPHPQSFISEKEMLERLKEQYPDGEKLEWNNDSDNFEVLRRSDVLISDFSGVLFDFSLVFDKPVIYTDTQFDKAPYDAAWIDEELWTFKILPKLGMKLTEQNVEELGQVIDDVLASSIFQEGREQARRETWNYPGQAVSRTVDYLIRKVEQMEKENS